MKPRKQILGFTAKREPDGIRGSVEMDFAANEQDRATALAKMFSAAASAAIYFHSHAKGIELAKQAIDLIQADIDEKNAQRVTAGLPEARP